MSITGSCPTIYIALILYSFNLFSQVDKSEVKSFISAYSANNNISPDEVSAILSAATFQPSIIEKMDRPAEKRLLWNEYRNIFIKPERIAAGIEFVEKHHSTLQEVSRDTGVPAEVIAAIIGVETYFGKIKGSYKVLDALYTLSFAYPRRAKYFRSELEEFLTLTRKENLDVFELKGSYAGAIGYCQFMPSSYRAYAVSFDEGNRDLVNSAEDAIASVANYLKVHRWQEGLPIATPANMSDQAVAHTNTSPKVTNNLQYFSSRGYEPVMKWPIETRVSLMQFETDSQNEYWFGTENFYVITRYNHSPLYALAVYQLAQEIKAAAP